MREKDGAPCGFETLITTGSSRGPAPDKWSTKPRPKGHGPNRGGGAERGGFNA
jgi:hypothetical protein